MADTKLKIDIRRSKILEYLKRDGRVFVSQLSQMLEATPVTIRNDLDALEKEGYLERIQGGAVLKTRRETDFSWCGVSAATPANTEEKRVIARSAVQRISAHSTVFLNSGTTTFAVAEALAELENLNVVTNSLAIAMRLGKVPTFRVLLLGGEINAQYGFTYGTNTLEQLRNYQADWSILSVDGVSASNGVTSYHAEETGVNRMMMDHAKHTMIVADHSKIGRAGFSYICDAGNGIQLVTDPHCDESVLAELRTQNVDIIIA